MVANSPDRVHRRRLRVYASLMTDLLSDALRSIDQEDLGGAAVAVLDARKLNSLFAAEGATWFRIAEGADHGA